MQIAPRDATWRPSQMETSKARVRRALETGAETLAEVLGLPRFISSGSRHHM